MSNARQQTGLVADRIRDDLVVTIRELDRRRLQATDVGYQVANLSRRIWKGRTVIAGVLLIGGAAAYVAVRLRRRNALLRGRS